MTNFAAAFKSEIARVSRKELRGEVDALRKTVATQRSDITALKRRTAELQKTLKALVRLAEKAGGAAAKRKPEADEAGGSPLRFRAAGLANNRQRLGLSATDFGLLVGTTGQSIYAWESGKSKPRPKALAAISALRGIGKKEVAERLAALKA